MTAPKKGPTPKHGATVVMDDEQLKATYPRTNEAIERKFDTLGWAQVTMALERDRTALVAALKEYLRISTPPASKVQDDANTYAQNLLRSLGEA